MPASRSDILRWLDEAKSQDARWMIVKCDSFDYHGNASDSCCYPVYATDAERVREVMGNADRTMEVYDLALSIDDQMAECRAMHPPEP